MPSTQSNLAPAFRKTTETFSAGAKSLAQRYFVSSKIFAKEQKKIFSEQWILVGHQSQIPKAGDYFIAEVAGESLIIVRRVRNKATARQAIRDRQRSRWEPSDMDGQRGALTSGTRLNQSAAFTMFAVIAARGSGKIQADTCRRFSVLITHGRMDSMGD